MQSCECVCVRFVVHSHHIQYSFRFIFRYNISLSLQRFKIPSDTQDKYALLCLLFGRVRLSPYCLSFDISIGIYRMTLLLCSIAYISFHIIKVSRTTNEKRPQDHICVCCTVN